MWQDVLHHVVGEHEWSDGQCSHSPLTLSDTDKPLLGKGSKAIEVLTKVILDQRWLESLVLYVWFKKAIFFYKWQKFMILVFFC